MRKKKKTLRGCHSDILLSSYVVHVQCNPSKKKSFKYSEGSASCFVSVNTFLDFPKVGLKFKVEGKLSPSPLYFSVCVFKRRGFSAAGTDF